MRSAEGICTRRDRALLASGALGALLVCFALCAAPAIASKTRFPKETFGSAAQPSFANDWGMTVDQSSGDLLVIDAGANSISRFKANGEPSNFSALGTNTIDGKGPGADQTPQNGLTFRLSNEVQIAIAPPGSAAGTEGDIYVTQSFPQHLIDIFSAGGAYLGQLTGAGAASFSTGIGVSPCGVAVDSGGHVFVGGSLQEKIYKFTPTANPAKNSDGVIFSNFSTSGVSRPCTMVSGAGPSAGSLFVAGSLGGLFKLNGVSGALQYQVDSKAFTTVTVDPVSGHVFGASGSAIEEYDAGSASSSKVSTTPPGGGGFGSAEGIAFAGATNSLYGAFASSANVKVFGPVAPYLPNVVTGAATNIEGTSATLHGTVDPDGAPVEECFFEYGLTAAYGQTTPCAETPASLGSGEAAVPVHADIAGLDPATEYHFRLLAKNANGTESGADAEFKTSSPPVITDETAEGVGTVDAKLRAQVNPEGFATTYRFEWGTDASYGNSTAEIALGLVDKAGHTVSRFIGSLQPDTTYHFRVVATNKIGTAEGEDRTFRTFAVPFAPSGSCPNDLFRIGPSANLPDCRAYEMVSPVDKEGADILAFKTTIARPASIYRSADSGERFTYSAYRSFGDAQSAPYTSQYLADRDPAQGWSTRGISPPRGVVSGGPLVGQETEYNAFSPDLCSAWLIHEKTTAAPLAPGAPEDTDVLYKRSNCGTAAGSYEALVTVPPLNHPTLGLELQGVSADGGETFFAANDSLTPGAPNPGSDPGEAGKLLYVSAGSGGVQPRRLVCVLPNGTVPKTCSAGTATENSFFDGRSYRVGRAVSEDGSRIFWSDSYFFPGKIYVRFNPAEEQSALDGGGKCTEATQACTLPVSPGAGQAQFWTASPDGRRAIFTTGAPGSGSVMSSDLLEFDLEAALAGAAEPAKLIAQEVAGVLGASEDARRIYLVSAKALDGGAKAGEPNLYLYEAEAGEGGAGGFTFIATLGSADAVARIGLSPSIPTPVNVEPFKHGARVSPDGDSLAFMASASLTGYDNTDIDSGEADAELYHYDAVSGKLECVSCNPSGARPAGRNIAPLGPQFWAAARMPNPESQLYAQRALSDDGSRLFFESFEALVLADTNAKQDVYQWEAAGSGDCSAQSPAFSEPNGGCLSLISSGESPEDSSFLDASPSGDDVFIRTGSSLVPQDPGLFDVYDARVGGGLPQPSLSVPCEGEACQSPPAPPQKQSPSSLTYKGPGSLKQAHKRRCAKGKRRQVRHGKARCVKRSKGKRHRHHHGRAHR
jgi:hypothetical protein